ncbi:MAG: hypothetical protein WAJ86_02735 [Candidatus Acidiferrales bacterium]
MRLCRSNAPSVPVSTRSILRDACRHSGLPLAAVLLVAFLPVISAKAQSPSPAPTQAPSASSQPQNSSPAPAQSSSASSASAPPVMQNASAPPQQSLGEAARQNAQKASPKPKHVYTNDDLSSMGGTISVVGDASSSHSDDGGDANSGAQGAGASSGSQDETYWRGRANAIKSEIADVDRQIEDKKAEIAKAGATSFDPSAGLSQGVIIIHDRNAELKELEDRKQSLENQLDQLADEGRKAGADSGWFR